ncbi:MAG TPA: hypothetical protein P5017_08155 [Anaerohalosphaeraceae bacterium]|nr:hypothetical protein [Anaerohalosphaeraceae bacterium]
MKKTITFRGFPAVQFKHTTYEKGKYTIHEGMIFFVQGDFVSLTCIYPSRHIPSPGFQEYLDSFEFVPNTPPPQTD